MATVSRGMTTSRTSTIQNKKSNGLKALIPEKWPAHLILIASCMLTGLPVLYAMIVGTQTNADVAAFRLVPGNSLADNINTVMVARHLGQYILNSVVVAVSITVGKTILSLLSGLAFVYFKFPGKWIVFGFVLITLMMPTEVLILALLRLVSDLGLGNNTLALIIPFLASATGTFLFRQHFANIPSELSEAAQLDGANPLQFLIRVLIPISWNAIGALAVIQFVYSWNMYLWPLLVISSQEKQVVQVGLQTLQGIGQGASFGPMMLGAVIASIPPVIVFILLQKQFMSGFALSRDK